MNKESRAEKKIHMSEIDEFLAAVLLEEKEKPIRLAVHKNENQGYISVFVLEAKENMEEEGIDFELYSCECVGLESMDISDFLEKPIFTSSAYEFFDFVLMFVDSFECLVDFTGNAWKIKILKTKNLEKT
jgi:hypothetical protein